MAEKTATFTDMSGDVVRARTEKSEFFQNGFQRVDTKDHLF